MRGRMQLPETNDIIKRLRREAWQLVATERDLHHFRHPVTKARITLPHPRKDIPPKTLRSVYRQAGWAWISTR